MDIHGSHHRKISSMFELSNQNDNLQDFRSNTFDSSDITL